MKKIRSLLCTVLLMSLPFWALHYAAALQSGWIALQVAAAELGASHTEIADVVSAVSARTGTQRAMERQVASVLQKLGKTLILEHTRGAKEVKIFEQAARAVVVVVTDGGVGSGTLIDGEGHVITNWHVISNQPRVGGGRPSVVVVLKPKDSTELYKELAFLATVEKVDQVSDLALLKINAPPIPIVSLPLGDVATLKVGQDVYAIGHPERQWWTFTKGIISQIRPNYQWSTEARRVFRAKVIQTQTPINPGNSGGPLLDDSGKLIGINSFRGPGEGLNYAVAVDEIQKLLQGPGGRKPAIDQDQAGAGDRCTEPYDTKGQGWTTILGCYMDTSLPPPNLWLVYRARQQPAAYMAFAGSAIGQIDTVIKSLHPQWQEWEYYIDNDCNGTVDLIARQRKGSAEPDRYRLPDKPLRLVTLAKELDSALKTKKLPYPKLRVCQ